MGHPDRPEVDIKGAFKRSQGEGAAGARGEKVFRNALRES